MPTSRIDEAEAEVAEIVGFLKDPEKYQRLGGRIPKGVLIVGPPGTGKTLLARAVAVRPGFPSSAFPVPTLSKCLSESGRLGSGSVSSAVKSAPSIIFIDELDAVGKARESTCFQATMSGSRPSISS